MEKILWAADSIREIHPQMSVGMEKRIRALILVMRHSGLRISDGVSLGKELVQDGRIFLYQAKTKEPVWIPVPDEVIESLAEMERGTRYYSGREMGS